MLWPLFAVGEYLQLFHLLLKISLIIRMINRWSTALFFCCGALYFPPKVTCMVSLKPHFHSSNIGRSPCICKGSGASKEGCTGARWRIGSGWGHWYQKEYWHCHQSGLPKWPSRSPLCRATSVTQEGPAWYHSMMPGFEATKEVQYPKVSGARWR